MEKKYDWHDYEVINSFLLTNNEDMLLTCRNNDIYINLMIHSPDPEDCDSREEMLAWKNMIKTWEDNPCFFNTYLGKSGFLEFLLGNIPEKAIESPGVFYYSPLKKQPTYKFEVENISIEPVVFLLKNKKDKYTAISIDFMNQLNTDGEDYKDKILKTLCRKDSEKNQGHYDLH